MRQLDELGVHGGTGVTDDLDVPLAELAVAAGLRTVVAEHRTDHPEAGRARKHVHPVLDEGTDDAGGRLGPERPLGALLVAARGPAHAEHLLFDRVAALAEPAREELDALEERDLDPLECIAAREVARDRLDAIPRWRLPGQDVTGAARRADRLRHGCECI